MNTDRTKLFTDQASDYSKYRPGYPDTLFAYIRSLCRNNDSALDVATGNGQVAYALAEIFKKVEAIDVSKEQLAHATPHQNVHYSIAVAESLPFEEHSFDLVTVGQAAHWFKLEDFYREVKRVSKNQGVLALFGYSMARISPTIDQVIDVLYNDILDGCWDPARKIVDDSYQSLYFPFRDINQGGQFTSTCNWDCNAFIGFLETWSAVAEYKRKNGRNPLDEIKIQLMKAWDGEQVIQINFPVFLKCARIEK